MIGGPTRICDETATTSACSFGFVQQVGQLVHRYRGPPGNSRISLTHAVSGTPADHHNARSSRSPFHKQASTFAGGLHNMSAVLRPGQYTHIDQGEPPSLSRERHRILFIYRRAVLPAPRYPRRNLKDAQLGHPTNLRSTVWSTQHSRTKNFSLSLPTVSRPVEGRRVPILSAMPDSA